MSTQTAVREAKKTGPGSLWVNKLPVWVKGKPTDPSRCRLVARRGRTVGDTISYRVHREDHDGVAWVADPNSIRQATATVDTFLKEFGLLDVVPL